MPGQRLTALLHSQIQLLHRLHWSCSWTISMPGLQSGQMWMVNWQLLYGPWLCQWSEGAQTNGVEAMAGVSSSFASQPALSLALAACSWGVLAWPHAATADTYFAHRNLPQTSKVIIKAEWAPNSPSQASSAAQQTAAVHGRSVRTTATWPFRAVNVPPGRRAAGRSQPQ